MHSLVLQLLVLGNWQHATYAALLAQAAGTPDVNQRKLLYRQAEAILVETDTVLLPAYYAGVVRARLFLPVLRQP
jgi:ABC-type oligopeptide transport system substrate-binding subunit